MISRVKGTQDFIDLSLYEFALHKIRSQLDLYHFTPVVTPILESVELFKRTLGLETDVVSKEMFIIKSVNPDDQEAICLRPEATAPITRAFIEHRIEQLPWKVYTWGPMFRYERPQKGRFRQFHQVSIELIGAQSIGYDAQCITMLDRLFHEQFNLHNYALLINFIGCPEDRAEYKKLVKKILDDNQDKICKLCMDRKEKNILRVFDCKTPTCQELYKKAPYITDHLCQICGQEWAQLQQELTLLSVTYVLSPTLVRGLDYYNKTVFEFVSDSLGAQSAFCAGGRYDSLVSQLGGSPDQPSIGAAIGIERLLLLLEPMQESLNMPQKPAVQAIIPLSKVQEPLALLLADELLAQGICTDIILDGGSIKSLMRKANKMAAAHVLLLGDDEQSANEVTVKNMVTGAQERIAQSKVVAYLKNSK